MAPALVAERGSLTSTTATNPRNITLNAGTAAGNKLIVSIGGDGRDYPFTMSDPRGNTWAWHNFVEPSGTNRMVAFGVCEIATAHQTGDVLSITQTANLNTRWLSLVTEWSDVQDASYLDDSGTEVIVTGTTTLGAGSPVADAANDLVLMAWRIVTSTTPTLTPGADYSALTQLVALTVSMPEQYKVQAGTGAITTAATLSQAVSGNTPGMSLALYAASAAPPPDVPAGVFDPGLNPRAWF